MTTKHSISNNAYIPNEQLTIKIFPEAQNRSRQKPNNNCKQTLIDLA